MRISHVIGQLCLNNFHSQSHSLQDKLVLVSHSNLLPIAWPRFRWLLLLYLLLHLWLFNVDRLWVRCQYVWSSIAYLRKCWWVYVWLSRYIANVGCNVDADGWRRTSSVCTICTHISILFEVSYGLVCSLKLTNKLIWVEQLSLSFLWVLSVA
jgi:hypothetical protein